jgi:hypothetical protein
VASSHGRTVQFEEATTLEDAVDDGLSEVFVVQNASPRTERLVRREDHRPLLQVSFIDDVEEDVRGVGAVRQVPDLVDNEHLRMRVVYNRVAHAPLAGSA